MINNQGVESFVPQSDDNKDYRDYKAFLKSGGKPLIEVLTQKAKGDYVASNGNDVFKEINDGLKSISGLMQMLPEIKARLDKLENKK